MNALEFLALGTQGVAESEIGTLCTLCLCGSRVICMDVVGIGLILNIILFVTLVTTDLCSFEKFEVGVSVFSALLKMIDALPVVTLAHLFSDQPSHHDLDPLFPDDSVSGICYSFTVTQVDALIGGRDSWLLSEEGFGLWSRHVELL